MGLLYALIISITSLIVSACLGSFRHQFGDIADSAGLVYGKKEVLANFLVAFFRSEILWIFRHVRRKPMSNR